MNSFEMEEASKHVPMFRQTVNVKYGRIAPWVGISFRIHDDPHSVIGNALTFRPWPEYQYQKQIARPKSADSINTLNDWIIYFTVSAKVHTCATSQIILTKLSQIIATHHNNHHVKI